MKKFALICDSEHEFEGWFQDADAIKAQAKKGFIDCPYCGSVVVRKQLSAPNLASPKTRSRLPSAPENSPETSVQPETKQTALASNAAKPAAQIAGPDAAMHQAAFRAAVQQLRKTIETEFTDVGSNFADEARKIHYGEREQANIYGTCTRQETEELLDEGVEITPLPSLPPEH